MATSMKVVGIGGGHSAHRHVTSAPKSRERDDGAGFQLAQASTCPAPTCLLRWPQAVPPSAACRTAAAAHHPQRTPGATQTAAPRRWAPPGGGAQPARLLGTPVPGSRPWHPLGVAAGACRGGLPRQARRAGPAPRAQPGCVRSCGSPLPPPCRFCGGPCQGVVAGATGLTCLQIQSNRVAGATMTCMHACILLLRTNAP